MRYKITRLGSAVVIHSFHYPYLGWHYAQSHGVETAMLCLRRHREVEFTQSLEVAWGPSRFQQTIS